MTTARSKRVAYWGLTGAFSALMALSGAMYLSGAPMVRDVFAHLGYPAYLLVILGVAKLAGVAGLLQQRAPTLREWAYAGFTIDLAGAIASHLFSGDSLAESSVPGVFLLILAASYALTPARNRSVTANKAGEIRLAA